MEQVSSHDRPALVVYPFDRSSPLDPGAALAAVRAGSGICKVRLDGAGEAWLVTDYDVVRELLMSARLGTQYPGAAPSQDSDSVAMGFMFLKDPPEHTRLRRAVARTFTAARIAQLRSPIADGAQILIAEMMSAGPPFDLMTGFAYPLPISIISELLGVPAVDRGRFREWADIVLGAVSRCPDEIAQVYDDLEQFIVGLVDAKPDGDDLVSQLVRNEGGEETLTRREVYSMSLGLLMAGYVTTSQALAAAVVRLLREPGLWGRLASRSVRVSDLVEEVLRCMDEERGIQRIAHEEFEVRGVRFAVGDVVILSRSGANRDPRVFDCPDKFLPSRSNADSHLTFGHGPHRCLGAQLARMELEVALETLADSFADLSLAIPESEIEWNTNGMDVSVQHLPVTW